MAGVAVAAVALTIPVIAQATTVDKATGGGQILLGSKGAGNTIAFSAQGTENAAKGQVQFIDRSNGNGRDQEKYHGIVKCIRAEGTFAEIGGIGRDDGEPFNLLVQDNGQGGTDMIQFDTGDAIPDCTDDDDDDTPSAALARGNAQVRDGDASQRRSAAPRTMTFKTALSLAGLR